MILAINSCCQKIEICLKTNDKVYYKSTDHKKNDTEFFLNSLNLIVTENNLNIQDISKIICVKGPGSFTAVRIGVIFANTLAHQLNVDLYEITTLEYLNLFVDDKSKLLVSAGGKEFYTYEDKKINILNLDNLDKRQNWCGDVSSKQLNLLKDDFIFKNANYNLANFLENQVNLNSKVKEIEPFYIKEANIDKNNLKKSKSGYFMVFASFLIVLFMTPLMLNIFENQMFIYENYSLKTKALEYKNLKLSFENQLKDNENWHGKFLKENFTTDLNFHQYLINKTVVPVKADQILSEDNLLSCNNFDFFNFECSSNLNNYVLSNPLLNYSDYSIDNLNCDHFNLNDQSNVNSECLFNKLQLGHSFKIPLFAMSSDEHENIYNPFDKFIKLRFKFTCIDETFECDPRILDEFGNLDNWLAISHKDNSPKVIDIKIISGEEVYTPNFEYFSFEEGRTLNNHELTLDKIKNPNLNLFPFLAIDNFSKFYEIDLGEMSFVNIKNNNLRIQNIFELEEPYLQISLLNLELKDQGSNAINSIDYQILSNFEIGLDKSIVVNVIQNENKRIFDGFRQIPITAENAFGTVISN